MKSINILIILLFLTFSVFGQNIVATTDNGEKIILKPDKTWEYAVKQNDFNLPVKMDGWVLMAEAKDKILGSRYYYQPEKVKTNVLDAKETWIRLAPINPVKFNAKYKLPVKTVFIQQFLSLDCRSERYSLESAVFYDKDGNILKSDRFWNSVGYEKIIPNTISSVIQKSLCG